MWTRCFPILICELLSQVSMLRQCKRAAQQQKAVWVSVLLQTPFSVAALFFLCWATKTQSSLFLGPLNSTQHSKIYLQWTNTPYSVFLREVPSLCRLIMATPLCQLCPWTPPHSQPPAAAVIAKDIVSERSMIEKSGIRTCFPIINKNSLEIKVEELAPLCVIQNHKFPLPHNLPELQTLLQLLKNSRCFRQVSTLPLQNAPGKFSALIYHCCLWEEGRAVLTQHNTTHWECISKSFIAAFPTPFAANVSRNDALWPKWRV